MMNFLYGIATATAGWVGIMAVANGHAFMFVVALMMMGATMMTWFVERQMDEHIKNKSGDGTA